MKQYNTGIVIGKFCPPHKGHHFLIDSAFELCDLLYVLVCWKPAQTLPVEIRIKCISERHPDAMVIEVKDILDDDDTLGWAAYTIEILNKAPDVVFSSEDYGIHYAKAMGAKHVMVDLLRKKYPCSGTMIRNNPQEHLQYLSPCMRAYYIKRICLVGAESTGKTTLAELLANYYNTIWVPEYGRTYCEEKWKNGIITDIWSSDEFVKIAEEQIIREDIAAKSANTVLICDTDAFATSIWHERYIGTLNNEVEMLACFRHYDLYILTGDEIPFVQDGLRDGENIRHWMHDRFVSKLTETSRKWKLVSGSIEERLNLKNS
jgi:HTH-type transcriptional regulator, transcriptional repressor of NAD biosynthesis genes